MPVSDEISDRLTAAFSPERMEIEDESEKHRGHGGWREGGETHFRVLIRARALGPLSRIARHRAVHAALGPDLVARIHALSLDIG
ncbi:MAG: BolA family protein [Paracoccaceae bacterium]|nr:BolA family protein [Paracoccaceae bacterium]